jgi:hypothetical protein
MSDAERLVEAEGIGNRKYVVGKSVPLKRSILWSIGVSVGTHIDRPLVETREVRSEWFPNSAVESGCMGEEERGSLATEIVDLDFNTVGGGDSHASILPLRCGTWRQIPPISLQLAMTSGPALKHVVRSLPQYLK